MAWWVCWDVSNSGFTVVVMFYTQRDLAGCFFFFPLSILVPEVEGERQKGKERERNSKKIIKNNI